jgi:hypothetical protein
VAHARTAARQFSFARQLHWSWTTFVAAQCEQNIFGRDYEILDG